MQRIPKRRYTAEFRAEAVKLVVEQGVGLAEAARVKSPGCCEFVSGMRS
jgi:transposase-like protein